MADFDTRATGKSVLVTGTSSGIGRTIAVYLAKRGFTVFATVRKEADAESLRNLNDPNLVPICPLDFSKPEHFPNVVEALKKELSTRGKEGLYALVNNAGGGFIAPVELMDLGKFRVEVETRIIGPVALVQSLLPLIRKGQGRILWIVTAGLAAIPYVSSIHACEFAATCIAHTLHLELTPWKIPNILIGCGGIKTSAPGRTARELEESLKQWSPERLELYSASLEKLKRSLTEFDKKRSNPEEVAKVVFKALCAKKPKRKYIVGYSAKAMSMLRFFPQSLIDYIFSKRL